MLAALDAGADDIADDGELWRVTTAPTDLHTVRTGHRGGGHGGRLRRPHDGAAAPTIPLDDAEAAKKVLRLIDALDEHDDVQNVYANFDIPDDILAEASVVASSIRFSIRSSG